MYLNHYVIALNSLLIGLLLVIFFKKIVSRFKFLTKNGMPLVGGLAIGISFFLSCSLFLLYKNNNVLVTNIKGVLLSSAIILLAGIIDDLLELSVLLKFFSQVLAVFVILQFGVKTQIVYIGNFVNIIITFIWLIGITNAFNLLDIADGLSAGTALIVSLAFLLIGLINKDINTTILILALMGATFSFLFFNFPPAKVYLGNSGSHFLGFVLGSVALMISYASIERKIALLSPIIILGFPIFDTLFLILMRLGRRKWPFKKTKDHLAMRFSALGFSFRKTLFIMLGLCLFFSFAGILLSQVSNLYGVIILILLVMIVIVLTKKMFNVVIYD